MAPQDSGRGRGRPKVVEGKPTCKVFGGKGSMQGGMVTKGRGGQQTGGMRLAETREARQELPRQRFSRGAGGGRGVGKGFDSKGDDFGGGNFGGKGSECSGSLPKDVKARMPEPVTQQIALHPAVQPSMAHPVPTGQPDEVQGQLFMLVQPLSPSPNLAQAITGMLLQLPRNELLLSLINAEVLSRRVSAFLEVLRVTSRGEVHVEERAGFAPGSQVGGAPDLAEEVERSIAADCTEDPRSPASPFSFHRHRTYVSSYSSSSASPSPSSSSPSSPSPSFPCPRPYRRPSFNDLDRLMGVLFGPSWGVRLGASVADLEAPWGCI